MRPGSSPENRIGCRVDLQLDGTVIVGLTDGSHAYAIKMTPDQLRRLAMDFWAVAERLDPISPEALSALCHAADASEVNAWN